MDEPLLVVGLGLAAAIAVLSVIARRLHVAPPMLLLIAGAALAFVPGLPPLELDPQFVLLVLLPPLLYHAGVGMSWRGFRDNLRPILLLAVGCVLFTASAVAAVAHYLLGLPWAVGFVLGAIVSPPDAVAPMAILRRLSMPRRIITILEGESLVNDATALVLFSIALGAVGSGQFSFVTAAGTFSAVVVGEIAYGIAIAWVMLRLRKRAAEPRAETLLAFMTPYLAFWLPHGLGGSGVIACVVAGLTVSWTGPPLITPSTRLQGFFIWDLVNWGIEALVFLLTGLQARLVTEKLFATDWREALVAGAAVSLTVILVRFVWVYPATYIPRLVPAVRRRDPFPNWRLPFLVSFAGLRGVVSLAAALSIPLAVGDQPFPARDLVLFVTFTVIAVTILGLGVALPAVVEWLGLARSGSEEAVADKRAEQSVRLEGIDAVLATLFNEMDNAETRVAAQSLTKLHADRRHHAAVSADTANADNPFADVSRLQLRMLAVERSAVAAAYAEDRLSDEARRRIERELDLEEARVNHALTSMGAGDIAPTE